jgi:manganese/zinc/iron transport system permease protein
MGSLGEFLSDYTVLSALLGCAVLGVMSGVLGCFAVLRGQGLMGDAMAHAALPGVCLAFLATGSKAPLVLMLGAALTGWLAMLAILGISSAARLDRNTVLGVMLTTFFGLGVVLLTVIQKTGGGAQAGLDKFLFGQAAALVMEDAALMAVLAVLALVVVGLLFKEFKLISFDPGYARSLGMPVGVLGAALTSLMLAAIVVGLNAVGVILMSAMLVAPAAAVRQWTSSLRRMVALSALIGAVCGAAGAVWSVRQQGVPTGPAIVILLTLAVAVSAFFGSDRGLVWVRMRRAKA